MSCPRALAAILPPLADKAIGKRGLSFGTVFAEWTSIISPRLVGCTLPFRIVFPRGQRDKAVLHVWATSSAALYMQYQEPQIIERINSALGYYAVSRLRVVKASLGKSTPAPPPPRTVPAEVVKSINIAVESIPDKELAESFARLWLAVVAAAPPPSPSSPLPPFLRR
ncbi:MAG: DciA family protein [Rhodospirillaceae bacterium]